VKILTILKTMNRQLKFRIWDKQNKKWLENSSSLHCFSSWTICPFTGNLVDYVGDFSCNSFTSSAAADYYWQGTTIIKEPRYIIQQYTGLQDCDGKEIYEGDIVSGSFYDEEYHHAEITKCEVRFNNGAFNIASRNWHRLTLKVVGNIFENPKLLKNEKL
jgi:uncharacterized phage protein (TIGR01671 family)